MLVAACGDAAKFFKPYQVWTCTGCQDTVLRFLPVRKPYIAHCNANRVRCSEQTFVSKLDRYFTYLGSHTETTRMGTLLLCLP